MKGENRGMKQEKRQGSREDSLTLSLPQRQLKKTNKSVKFESLFSTSQFM